MNHVVSTELQLAVTCANESDTYIQLLGFQNHLIYHMYLWKVENAI